MSNNLTVVMYHYVREIHNSKYPNIKGLELEGFKRQLDFLQSEFSIISAEDLIYYAENKVSNLPNNPCYLTFDDGYKDHYKYVLPELKKRKLQGSFFPIAGPILKKELLIVNAVHYILACCDREDHLVQDLNSECLKYGVTQEELKDYWSVIDKTSRYDSPKVIYVKRMLQRELPKELRYKVSNSLFEKYVGVSESEFSEKLYLSLDEIKDLISEGMYVGSHSYNHDWMDRCPFQTQMKDIELSLSFLKQIGAPTSSWIFCYPYGAYNNDTIAALKEKKCVIGLTTKFDRASLDKNKLLELSRFDTNHFPQ